MSQVDSSPAILVVDDDEMLRTIISALLISAGMPHVTVCSDVSSARSCLAQTRFDLVLSDIQIGSESGLDLLRYIRAAPELRTMPVVLMTASGCEHIKREAEQAGADHFLRKPFSPALLRTIVGAAMSSRAGDQMSC